jgi:MSHA biogenesis protein MshQ
VGVSVTCQCDTFGRAALNPSTIFGGNWVATTSDATGIVPRIVNSGYLRLTENTANNAKAATVPGIFPAAGNYISVEFKHYAYNGSGADGIAVTLSDYAVPAVPGAFGGSLGYAQRTGVNGFAGGWIGVALDEYGNYQNPTEGRSGGPGFIVQSVGIRGSGLGTTGYPWLRGTANLTTVAPNVGIDNRTSTTPSLGDFTRLSSIRAADGSAALG